nr:hypothetical protein [Planococcus glaciei]
MVFESTVYPGATEEQCIPVLEEYSGLEAGSEFFVGYSPERVQSKEKKQVYAKTKKSGFGAKRVRPGLCGIGL